MITVPSIPHDEAFNCTEEALRTLAAWLERNVMLMYASCWRFEYTASSAAPHLPKIGDRLQFDLPSSANYQLLRDHHGIDVLIYSEAPEQLAGRIVSQLKLGKPVALDIDGYWCPWITAYRKGHIDHGVCITGWSEEDASFIGVDSYYGQSEITLPHDHLLQGALNCYTYELQQPSTSFTAKAWLSRIAGEFHASGTLDALRRFGEELAHSFNFARESEGEPVYEQSRFYLQFDRYRRSRRKLAKVLAYLAHEVEGEVPALIRPALEAEQLFKHWNAMHKLFLKLFLSGRFDSPRTMLISEWNEIVRQEEEIYHMLAEQAIEASGI
ncbi:hypothetical protein PaecuDRAFT_1577 [Paenibacillus curdlanolyticus YK9]|uniref:Butirosin biosynthesis protein H N-terminal domain-containing protein n=1 Tax=Paenibacillus curdlanolyticus YK9 TaxID=717606 RepID=E0I7F3_9BACL|nr:hypothetical protein [Paenibacillus curdlanolyticus]EFM11969.1 hypothetical protein PaecuDRAFT_1577 [Paenibacillus curdlanolyticus YK9]